MEKSEKIKDSIQHLKLDVSRARVTDKNGNYRIVGGNQLAYELLAGRRKKREKNKKRKKY